MEHLKEVIIEDSLGICDELDTSHAIILVDTYHDEWAEVVKDPTRRAKFKQFANTDRHLKDDMIEFVDMRGQPSCRLAQGRRTPNQLESTPDGCFCQVRKVLGEGRQASADFAPNVGTPILYGDTQLAVFNNANRGEWYCTQNMCPHKQAFVLSQGIIGDAGRYSQGCMSFAQETI